MKRNHNTRLHMGCGEALDGRVAKIQPRISADNVTKQMKTKIPQRKSRQKTRNPK